MSEPIIMTGPVDQLRKARERIAELQEEKARLEEEISQLRFERAAAGRRAMQAEEKLNDKINN